MKVVALLLFVGAASASHLAVVAPHVTTTQYHAQDELGQYAFGYSGGPSAKEEIRTADGVTRGGYDYVDAHGLVQSARYVADPHNGFRVAATNLPVGPAVPAGHVISAVHASPVVHAAPVVSAVHSPILSGLHLLKKRSLAAVPLVAAGHGWAWGRHWGPSAAAYGGYDTPEVTSAKIAHAQYQVAQRAAVATEAAANGHGLVLGHGIVGHGLVGHGLVGHYLKKRSLAAVPLVAAGHGLAWGSHWVGPSAAAYGGYDTPEVTSAKIAHANYQVAQRAAVATEAAANGHGLVLGHGIVGHGLIGHGHYLKKRSLAAVPLVAAGHGWAWGSHWAGPSAAAYGGYDTPEVTHAKIAHANAHVAQRATLAATAASNHGVWAHGVLAHTGLAHGHLIGKRSIAAIPLAAAGHGLAWGSHWVGPSAAAYGGYDTPEVTSAKIAHANAQVAQRATLAATAAADPDNWVHHGVVAHGIVGHGLVGHGHGLLLG